MTTELPRFDRCPRRRKPERRGDGVEGRCVVDVDPEIVIGREHGQPENDERPATEAHDREHGFYRTRIGVRGPP